VNAQTNVYSLNVVGYVNVTVLPGYNIISCPLNASPDNTVGTVLNNADGHLTGSVVYFFEPGPSGGYSIDTAENQTGKPSTTNANGWVNNGTNVLGNGSACWFQNTSGSNITLTFVGTVPSGPSLPNPLSVGFNLVSSVLPTSGDIISNSLINLTNYNLGDTVFTYANSNYTTYQSGSGKGFGAGNNGNWTSAGDPVLPTVGGGFWYQIQSTGQPINWVESYSVGQ